MSPARSRMPTAGSACANAGPIIAADRDLIAYLPCSCSESHGEAAAVGCTLGYGIAAAPAP